MLLEGLQLLDLLLQSSALGQLFVERLLRVRQRQPSRAPSWLSRMTSFCF